MDLHFPINSEDEVIEKYDKFFEEHKNVKIAVLGRFHGFTNGAYFLQTNRYINNEMAV